MMNAEDYCEELLYLKERIDHLRKILENIFNRDDISFVRSQNYDGTGVHGRQWKGGVFREIEMKIDNLPAVTSDYKKAMQEYVNKTKEFSKLISRIKSDHVIADLRHSQYLANRYIFGMDLYDIANEMGLSYGTVKRLGKTALEALQKVLDQREKQGE